MNFSMQEKLDLLKAWVCISFAFALLMKSVWLPEFPLFFLISSITVGAGFLLHEIAHKAVAHNYSCYTEFRADNKMLVLAVISSFFGFVFAAPGAVIIHGRITKERNGKISIAGPLSNIALALLFLLLSLAFKDAFYGIFSYGFNINSFLALFNMIPVMNFDGKKILEWSKPVYFSTLVISVILVIIR